MPTLPYPPAPTPTYGYCILEGYQYAYNPMESTDPLIRSVSRQATLNGNIFTDYGLIETDRVIEQKWPLMEQAVYYQLWAIMAAGGTLSFIDEWGGLFPAVVMKTLTYDSTTPGGDCFVNVKLTLWIIS